MARQRQQLLDREGRLAEREALLKRRLDDQLGATLREARAEVDRVVGGLKLRAQALAQGVQPAGTAPRLSTGDVGALRAEARTALGAIGERLQETAAPPVQDTELDEPPSVGQTVFVSTFAAEGIVREVSDKHVQVEVRGKRMRVRLSELRRPERTTPARPTKTAAQPFRGGATSSIEERVSRELVVIGSTVDEAIDRAEKFLDDALLADERRLRVVHGHGTGRLREALTKFFRQHPLVASASPAPENEGGNGATIVELKE